MFAFCIFLTILTIAVSGSVIGKSGFDESRLVQILIIVAILSPLTFPVLTVIMWIVYLLRG